MHLSDLYLHPVKSCAALQPGSAEVEPRGLAHDRRWMIVDGADRFVTGRQLPRTVLVRAEPVGDRLRLQAPGQAAIEVPWPDADAPRRTVSVWKDRVEALDAGDAAARWLGAFLQRAVRLVYMDAAATRAVDPKRARPGDEVSFADGYPLLLVSQAALEGLNARLARALPMARFRPNLVVAGAPAHAEDGWRRLRIGEVEFEAVKPCVRCVFTTIDPERGEPDPDGEPLRTLKTYRRSPDGISFGVNLIARGRGRIAVGDPVHVLD